MRSIMLRRLRLTAATLAAGAALAGAAWAIPQASSTSVPVVSPLATDAVGPHDKPWE